MNSYDNESFSPILDELRVMRPVRGAVKTGKASKNLVFHLEFDDSGEPFVSTVPIENKNQLKAADSRMLEELKRLGDKGGFDNLWNIPSGEKIEVSLWKYPYLTHMLRECQKVVGADGQPLEFSDDFISLTLRFTSEGMIPVSPSGRNESDSGQKKPDAAASVPVKVVLVAQTPEGEIESPRFLSDTSVLASTRIYSMASAGMNYPKIYPLMPDVIPSDLLEAYASIFASFFSNISLELNGVQAKISKNAEHAAATIILEKVAPDKALYLRATDTVSSLGDIYTSGIDLTRVASIEDDGRRFVVRDIIGTDLEEKVDKFAELVEKSAPTRQARKEIYRDGNFFIIPEETAAPFLLHSLPAVLSEFNLLGSDKLREYKVSQAMPKLNVKLSSGIDFLEGDADVVIGKDKFTIADFLAQFARNRYVTLSDGNRAVVDERYIRRLQRLFSRKSDKNGKVKVSLFDLPEIEGLIEERVKGRSASHTREVFAGFNRLKDMAPQAYDVNARLRPYQTEGVKWIKYLYDNKLGGCLADDMGLGKTLQTIAVLSMVYPRKKEDDAPALIVMPRSLLFNWEKEFEKFAPQISVATYYGPARVWDKVKESDVILTTYGTVRNDIEQMRKEKFGYVILDESQNIKNLMAQSTQAVMLLDSPHRLALSGTPMENNLTEIYSLFRFLNPTMFGSADDFNALYTYPIQRDGDKDATDSLRRKLFPFLLRRVKGDVLKDLPDRIDQVRYVEMTPEQSKFYHERRLEYQASIKDIVATQGVAKSQFLMFQALSELRRIASVPESLSDGRVKSPKLAELVEGIVTATANGHKSVVFFNFIAGIELVGERLAEQGITFETMSGSTSAGARKSIVNRFQTDPELKVLLMTLKVGGVGLNLTAADTVFIVEPWWNKAAEEQAINRLHRIGQKATVTAFSLITVGTIEEKILQLQDQKKQLFDDLITADSSSLKSLTEEDIDFILS